ncbi:MAG: hypothetical protein SGCHY_004319, partial [Lobulomycetales sp.]
MDQDEDAEEEDDDDDLFFLDPEAEEQLTALELAFTQQNNVTGAGSFGKSFGRPSSGNSPADPDTHSNILQEQIDALRNQLMARTGEMQIVRAQLEKSNTENLRLSNQLATAKQSALKDSQARISALGNQVSDLETKLRFSQ